MRNNRPYLTALAAIVLVAGSAIAQSSSGNGKWFVPKPAADTSTAQNTSGPRASRATQQSSDETPAQVQVGLPPLPGLPQIDRGASPPAAVIGVLDVTGVLRSSVAYQAVQKEMQGRQNSLNSDAQKEQARWREMNQTLTDQQKNETADQYATKQKQLQDTISDAEKQFKARDQLNQDAANYASEQIQAVLNEIVQQVADSRGINMVLYQTDVVPLAPGFDISAQVATELNQILPSVLLPPEGADVAAFARAHQAKAPSK